MKLHQAIKVAKSKLAQFDRWEEPDAYDALQLLTEAGEFIELSRQTPDRLVPTLLWGETPPGDSP